MTKVAIVYHSGNGHTQRQADDHAGRLQRHADDVVGLDQERRF